MTARKTRRTSSTRERKQSEPAKTTVDLWQVLLQREVWGLTLTAIGIVTSIALVAGDQGRLSSAWSRVLRQMFGVGAYPVALLLVASGVVLLFWVSLQDRLTPRWQTLVGSELVFFFGLGLIHLTAHDSPLAMARGGKYGGWVGWALHQLTVPLVGKGISFFLFAALVLMGMYFALGNACITLFWRIRWLWAKIGMGIRKGLLDEPGVQVVYAAAQDTARPTPVKAPSRRRLPKKLKTAEPKKMPPASPVPKPRPATRRAAKPKSGLPSLDLLSPEQARDGDEADARLKAQIIEETLDAFGVPAEVVEWNRGPVVTQFGIEPGFIERRDREGNMRRYKIRVSKILSLTNDLALALAAAPIRIEAPVPGRGVVGIEVPNDDKAVVGLRGALESPAFKKMRARLRIALGQDVSGHSVIANLAAMPHLLLAGATGSGKSVCLNAIIASLLCFNTPDQLQMLLVDPKRVELTKYNGIPHLVAPVLVDTEKVIVALRWVTHEMERRYEAFAKLGVRNLGGYQRLAEERDLEPLPMLVVIIDELADLMLAAPDDVERMICRLAQMARATGIHLVIATQRPSVDVVTGLIKANFPARISFAVTSLVDSRVILDVPGAEKLLGRGDMLFMAPDSAKLQRIQGCFVSDQELDALVHFWRSAKGEETQEQQPAPWEGMADESSSDDAIEQAIELVSQHNQASASFLQRHMRIGYPRAARMIDQLEEMGVVGPAETGGRSRVVLVNHDTEDDMQTMDDGVEAPSEEEN